MWSKTSERFTFLTGMALDISVKTKQMTESELSEIRTAINAARQYSEDNPEGTHERLLIECIPVMQQAIDVWALTYNNKERPQYLQSITKSLADAAYVYGLDIARAINHKEKEAPNDGWFLPDRPPYKEYEIPANTIHPGIIIRVTDIPIRSQTDDLNTPIK